MRLINIKYKPVLLGLVVGLAVTGCQKMERPVLKELILDPEPPAYNELKSFWSFENNLTDGGENSLTPTSNAVTYVAGVTGQAAQIGADGYILLKAATDTVVYDNEFVGIPADTLKNLGSFTFAFWMNGVGPVKDGAQGVFSISNSAEFWGNLDMFLENQDNGNEAFFKIHMFNANAPSGNGEQWNEVKVANVYNKWTHIAVVYDAATSALSLFADGAATGIANKKLTFSDGSDYGKVRFANFNGMVLGTHQFQTAPSLTNHGPEGWAKSFNGALDQFRIYNRALSSAEIDDLYTTKK